jgi:ketosteroid isomerase-like protein
LPGASNIPGSQGFQATFFTAGTRTLQVGDGALSTSTTIDIAPKAASHLTLTGLPANGTAGDAQSFTLAARDEYGNLATSYSGSVTFASTDGSGTVPGPTGLAGSPLGLQATFLTAGLQSITADDGTLSGAANILVVPRAAASLTITNREVLIGGDYATEVAGFEWTLAPVAGGPPVVDRGSYMQVWHREADGRWKFSREVWNSSTPLKP